MITDIGKSLTQAETLERTQLKTNYIMMKLVRTQHFVIEGLYRIKAHTSALSCGHPKEYDFIIRSPLNINQITNIFILK